MTQAAESERVRPLLGWIAYQILGSVSDAEDAVARTPGCATSSTRHDAHRPRPSSRPR